MLKQSAQLLQEVSSWPVHFLVMLSQTGSPKPRHCPPLFKKVSTISEVGVATGLRCVAIFNADLLQIYCWLWGWKNFENRSSFGEVTGRCTLQSGRFLNPSCCWWAGFRVTLYSTIEPRSMATRSVRRPSDD